jgi:hypothetical protein
LSLRVVAVGVLLSHQTVGLDVVVVVLVVIEQVLFFLSHPEHHTQ